MFPAAALAPVLLLLSPQAPPSANATPVAVRVLNPAPVARSEIVSMSVPFAVGALPAPTAVDGREPLWTANVRGGGDERTAPAQPLLRWPDGSVAVLQVHARCDLPASGHADLQVEPRRAAAGGLVAWAPGPHRPLLPTPLPLWTELLDPWGRVLRADLVPDPAAGPGGVLLDAGPIRITRFRAPHRAVDGAPSTLFELRAYLRTVDGARDAELTLVLDNQEPALGALGPCRFRGFRLRTSDPRLRFVPRFVDENQLPTPTAGEGGFAQWLVPPGESHYLGDGTAKTFRVQLFADDPALDDAARQRAAWAPLHVVAFPDLDAVRASRAFGAHGGPAPAVPGDNGFAANQIAILRRDARYGLFTGWGDPENGGLTGMPRHGDSMLHNALRWQSAELMAVAEGMVLQHTLRPTAGRAERLPADTEALRSGLGPLALAAPHGFTQPDYEHVAAALLFDHYWLTGDPLARDELARLGAGALALLRGAPLRTSRGEGVGLEAIALCARATGNRALLAAAVAHVRTALLPLLEQAPPHAAVVQPQLLGVLDGASPFDAPWQMALLVRGLAAVERDSGGAGLGPAIARIADAMATSGWAEAVGTKSFVHGADASRYSVAAVPADQAGYDRIAIGAFELAGDWASDPEVAARLRSRVRFLLSRELPAAAGVPERALVFANPWLQIALDRQARTQ